MSVEIRVETDEEEAAVMAAHKAGELDVAGLDYAIRRDHRTLGVRFSNNASVTTHWGDRDGAGAITYGGGGGGGTSANSIKVAPGQLRLPTPFRLLLLGRRPVFLLDLHVCHPLGELGGRHAVEEFGDGAAEVEG